jgi:hypothetical protein
MMLKLVPAVVLASLMPSPGDANSCSPNCKWYGQDPFETDLF